MIEAVIFDMDGVLLDSEPFWHDAEMEVFATVGLHLTRQQCMETMGVPVDGVVAYRFSQHPWNNKTQEQVTKEIFDGVIRRIRAHGVLMDGVSDIIKFFQSNHLPLALASSSPVRMIEIVLEKIGLQNIFPVIHSAEHEEYGKPHPAVFLSTAKELGIDATHCLVIEDSFNGLIAAKAARMKTLVVPIVQQQHEARFDIADLKLASLADFSKEHWQHINAAS
jgi:mannitol-1-/sugar-/sorbitol-6-/2-deoxyglucose-6-phosphatase